MHDPDLHLFITDDEIFAIKHLTPMPQIWRKDALEPVIVPEGEEGTAIGYATAIRDLEDGQFKVWYMTHKDRLIRLAVSPDGYSWTKRGVVGDPSLSGRVDNMHVSVPTEEVDPWFRGAKFVGTAYFSPAQKEGGPRWGSAGEL